MNTSGKTYWVAVCLASLMVFAQPLALAQEGISPESAPTGTQISENKNIGNGRTSFTE